MYRNFYLVSCYFCRVRFHYGHPDVFDRIFHITRGGISKASRGINLSEDIFAGKLFLFTKLQFLTQNDFCVAYLNGVNSAVYDRISEYKILNELSDNS
jgi:1,3-beta-glucan synthase component